MKEEKMKKKWIIGIIVVVVIGLAIFGYFRITAAQKAQASTYQTSPVEKGELIGMVGATGTVRADQSAYITWQTGGTVEKVFFDTGDSVKAGDILASLQKTSLSPSIILAEADLVTAEKALENLRESDLAAAKAQLAVVNAQEKYDDKLQKRKALNYKVTYSTYKMTAMGPSESKIERDATPKEIAEADANLAVAAAELEDAQREWDRLKDGPDPRDLAAAEARVAAAQATINLQSLIAPFDGVVTDASIQKGDVVSVGTRGFRLDNLGRLLVDVEISEIDVNQVKPGQVVTLTFDAIPTQEYHGIVTEVARVGTSQAGVVNFNITVEIQDADDQVLPQMTAAVNIVVVQLENVILIPNRAVRLVDGQRVVYLLKDGQPEMVEIELGSSSDLMSELLSGDVKVGDQVILNPPTNFFMGPGAGMQIGR
jgi:HlyD family secretion protein